MEEKNINLSGSALITEEGIKKHFLNTEPYQALIELIWNGFDAKANTLQVNIKENGVHGLELITILDDGDGIRIENLDNTFGKFNDSEKKHDETKHGSHGKGRLAFHRLCDKAVWYTKNNSSQAVIEIDSSSIKDYRGDIISAQQQHHLLQRMVSGTCVELDNFSENLLPDVNSLLTIFSIEFGWFLALNTDKNIIINGLKVPAPENQVYEKCFRVKDVEFEAKIVRWIQKPKSEKSYNYFVTSQNRVVIKELSKFNNKTGFYTSAYIFSNWVDEYDPNLLDMDKKNQENKKVVANVMKQLQDIQKEIYKDYLRRFVDSEIEKFDSKGYFPNYKGIDESFAHVRKQRTKSVLREIYIAEPTLFNSLKAKQTKIIIRLLDTLLVSNESDALFDVLENVLDLNDDSMKTLSEQLKKTTLANIVNTIESLQKREYAVHKLRELIGVRHAEVLETPDLQKIIESNTWLFGPQYTTIGAEEDTFTKIAKQLRNKVKGIDQIDEADVFEDVNVEGANRQVDLFLARKIPTVDSSNKEIFKCVIVEIKRPSISLNKKHLQQLDDYAEIISKHPDFSSDKLVFELILIGRKVSKDDLQIRQRLGSLKDRCEYGLVTDSGNMKCYVKDWFTLFDEFALSNSYLIGNLKTKLSELSDINTPNMIESLQKEIA